MLGTVSETASSSQGMQSLAASSSNGMQSEDAAAKPKCDKSGKGAKVKCKLCMRLLPIADFPVNSPYCLADKRAVDNLHHQAKVQGMGPWFQEVRNKEGELRKLVQKYSEVCPPAAAGKHRGKMDMVKYVEEFKAQSEVRYMGVGVMMYKERFVEFAQTFRNPLGKMSKEEAEAQWEQWKSTPEHVRDESGPKHSTLRLRVRTDDEVSFPTCSRTARLSSSRPPRRSAR